jgi:hypothetical protein
LPVKPIEAPTVKFPRVRLTVRSMMVLVAITALLLGMEVMRRRRNQYQRLAQAHASSMKLANLEMRRKLREADLDEHMAKVFGGREALELRDQALFARSMAGYWSQMETYHRELRRKYADAASTPWRLVSSDPPPPSNPLPR